MLVCIINSENEYLDLISGIVNVGLHRPNRFMPPDEDGMSKVDSFEKFDIYDVYKYLGAYTKERPPGSLVKSEGGFEYYEGGEFSGEEYRNRFINRENLKLHYDHDQLLVPRSPDYPIIICWSWYDSFDRTGKITERLFWWESLKSVETGASFIYDKANLWNSKYETKGDR